MTVKEPSAFAVASGSAVPLRVRWTTWPAASAAVEVNVPWTVNDRPGTAVPGAVRSSEVAAFGPGAGGAPWLMTGPLTVCTSALSPVAPEKARSAVDGSVAVASITCVPSIQTYT